MSDNEKLTDEFLTDHSYIWLVAKSMVQYMGFSDMMDFINNNYYIKANLTKNRMIDKVSGVMDLSQYPDDYNGFVYAFAKGLLPGTTIDEINYDFDRNNLLGKYEGRRYFLSKEYSFGNRDSNILQLDLYCQLFREDEDVYASILVVNMSSLYNKSANRKVHSEFDTLSGLFNRAYGEHHNIEYLQYHPDDYAAVIIVKIDDFGRFDIEHRHRMGGTVIADIAARLTDIFHKDCIISRTGIDEFTIFMKNGNVHKVNEAIEELLQEEFLAQNGEESEAYKISIGYAIYPEDSRDYSELSRMAETAVDYLRKSPNAENNFRYDRQMMDAGNSRMGLNMMDIADGIPGALLVCRTDAAREILYANHDMVSMFECEDFEEFKEWVEDSQRGLVYHEDAAHVEKVMGELLETGDTEKSHLICHHITTRKGVIHEVEATCRIVNSSYYGKILYIFLRDIGNN